MDSWKHQKETQITNNSIRESTSHGLLLIQQPQQVPLHVLPRAAPRCGGSSSAKLCAGSGSRWCPVGGSALFVCWFAKEVLKQGQGRKHMKQNESKPQHDSTILKMHDKWRAADNWHHLSQKTPPKKKTKHYFCWTQRPLLRHSLAGLDSLPAEPSEWLNAPLPGEGRQMG